mmetsp:Transcript_125216/g.348414  ORF Transcript_125216/g.348414 Transcript_125216/m.348414 type:complete len:231 (-) Transcript_125216:93-785(-)|eukprot:CAMPEP_0179084752 /NCGR_PEP_ID=MMETSP0796-20121207/38344_1 /TAXON_ID=73915 /ORGANISM="Pyrodinium bahamense, Strain pbaha01" /LENGTH=230 /DNA_ID=CAMNT_0020782177 /DNA_START=214 /DNA_END=906 /DNA_ORIENTATION=+
MKPDWDKLVEEYKDSPTSGVYDVDCTADGKDLCEKQEVKGYPTIKHGDPDNLQAYEGGRTYEDLKKFAEENLGPQCGPSNLDLCDADTKAMIEGFLKMSKADLDKKIAEIQKATSEKDKAFQKKFRKFKAKYADFKSEQAEEEEQLEIQRKEKDKFEKNKAKASKADITKQEKKDKKAKERADKLEKKRKAMKEENGRFEKEQADLAEEVAKSGLKHMKVVAKQKAKEEL